MATNSPVLIRSETSRNAWMSTSPMRYVFETFLIWIKVTRLRQEVVQSLWEVLGANPWA
jgi:hypothetical protein